MPDFQWTKMMKLIKATKSDQTISRTFSTAYKVLIELINRNEEVGDDLVVRVQCLSRSRSMS